jgi:uncharacterized protein (UPF0147 family)
MVNTTNKGWKMQFKTIDVVTRLGKIAKANKQRDHSNTETVVYKVKIVNAPNMPVYTIGNVNGIWNVYINGDKIGNATKLRCALKVAASHAIDKIDSIKPDSNIYSYSRGNGANMTSDNFTAKTVNSRAMKIKHHRHTVFH